MSEEGKSLYKRISSREEQLAKILIEQNQDLKSSLNSGDPDLMVKAQMYLAKRSKNSIQSRSSNGVSSADIKSVLIDPNTAASSAGYLDKFSRIGFDMLRNMSRAPIPRAIINTRKAQGLSHAIPQENKYSAGFVIERQRDYFQIEKPDLTDEDKKNIKFLTEFLLTCGEHDEFSDFDFEDYIGAFIEDSLVLDQPCTEIISNRLGEPHSFLCVDGATMRIANTYFENQGQYSSNNFPNFEEQNGYLPSHVQIVDGTIKAIYYPWEMGFWPRHKSTSIYSNGYGRSELEDLISTVTAMLNADAYNANYFKVGSNPKGFLRVSGNVNPAKIDELKESWQATVAGVQNAHKMFVLEADKLDFISTQQSNKDMEWSNYKEFLIRTCCSIFKIAPEEIGWHIRGENAPAISGEKDSKSEVLYSRDKGLKPLLRHIERKINKKFIKPFFNGRYVFRWVGLDGKTEQGELEEDIKKLNAGIVSLEKMMEKYGEELDQERDIILNPVYLQYKQMMAFGDEGGTEFVEQEENPFEKSLNSFLERL